MALSAEEIQRYKRHLLLREVGGPGQQRLSASRVLVIGAGGIGSPVLLYLAAAGVGTLGIADDDTVSLDNLQRQVVHATAAVGEPKVVSAERTVRALNPHVSVVRHETRVTAANALELVGRYDLVIDGSDNFATRYLVSDACYFAARPLLSAAVGPFDGYLTLLKPFASGADGVPNPTYRCLFPAPPPAGTVPACEEAGILGAVVGVIGTLAATEALKELIGIGEGLTGRLLIYDAAAARFETVRVAWDPDNPLTGCAPTIRELGDPALPA